MNHVTCIYMDKDGYCNFDGYFACPFDDVCQCQSSDLMTTYYDLETNNINDYDAASLDLPF